MKIRKNYPLKKFTTLAVGGPAKYFVEIKSEAELGVAYVPGLKTEIEAVLSPGTEMMKTGRKFYTKIEGRRISAGKIVKSFNFLSRHFDFVIVEGVGGAMVPFTDKRLVIDIVKELNVPVIIVAGNKLGAINHTLLTIEALRARKIKILGLVFNNMGKGDKLILEDNPRIIKALSGQIIFGTLPWEPSYKKLYKRFTPIGERIFKRL